MIIWNSKFEQNIFAKVYMVSKTRKMIMTHVNQAGRSWQPSPNAKKSNIFDLSIYRRIIASSQQIDRFCA